MGLGFRVWGSGFRPRTATAGRNLPNALDLYGFTLGAFIGVFPPPPLFVVGRKGGRGEGGGGGR